MAVTQPRCDRLDLRIVGRERKVKGTPRSTNKSPREERLIASQQVDRRITLDSLRVRVSLTAQETKGRADLCFNPMRVGALVALTVAVWRRT